MLTARTIRVTALVLALKIELILLFFDNCFKWNFFLTSTMLIGFLVVAYSFEALVDDVTSAPLS